MAEKAQKEGKVEEAEMYEVMADTVVFIWVFEGGSIWCIRRGVRTDARIEGIQIFAAKMGLLRKEAASGEKLVAPLEAVKVER